MKNQIFVLLFCTCVFGIIQGAVKKEARELDYEIDSYRDDYQLEEDNEMADKQNDINEAVEDQSDPRIVARMLRRRAKPQQGRADLHRRRANLNRRRQRFFFVRG